MTIPSDKYATIESMRSRSFPGPEVSSSLRIKMYRAVIFSLWSSMSCADPAPDEGFLHWRTNAYGLIANRTLFSSLRTQEKVRESDRAGGSWILGSRMLDPRILGCKFEVLETTKVHFALMRTSEIIFCNSYFAEYFFQQHSLQYNHEEFRKRSRY